MRRVSLSCFDQINELPDLKHAYPAYQDLPSHVLQDVLRRLDKAFAAFFRRLRNGEQPGYPRFKSTSRYHSFSYPDGAGWKLQGEHLNLAGVGEVKVKLHRELHGTIKTVTVRRDVDQWYVTCSCEVPEESPLPVSEAAVGLDLGVLHFATLSTGEQIENPRHAPQGAQAHQAPRAKSRIAARRVLTAESLLRLPWLVRIAKCAISGTPSIIRYPAVW
jgi:putative transposase